MPAGLSHYLLAQCVAQSFEKQNRNCNEAALLFGAQAPDFLYFYTFLRKSEPNLGVLAHRENTRTVFESFRRNADSSVDDSFVYGYLSHYAFDVTAHPFVYWLEKRYLDQEERKKKSKFHFQIESDLDVLLFRKLIGEMNFGFPFSEASEPDREARAEIWGLVEAMFSEVFGKETEQAKFERCWTNYKRLNRMKADPNFWKRKVLLGAENLFRLPHNSSLLLWRENPDERALNLAHERWHNPFDPRFESDEDFFALFERAKSLTIELCDRYDEGKIGAEFDLHLLKATPSSEFSESS